jgi:hypothetical protein
MSAAVHKRQVPQEPVLQIAPTNDPAVARRLQRAAKSGDLVRVAERIYVRNGSPEEITFRVRSNWQKIAGALYPGAVVSHLSAFRGGITQAGLLTLSHPTIYNRTRVLAGALTVVLMKGPARLPEDLALGTSGLFWASRPRMLLENLGTSRTTPPRRAGRGAIEEQLIAILNASGDAELGRIRDRARELAELIEAQREFNQLDSMVGALLGTRAKGELKTRMCQLVAAGTPADAERMSRFNVLADALRSTVLPVIPDIAASGAARIHLAFLESYFSNYVEGTRFSIAEAEDIVLRNQIVPSRPKDSHDVLGVFAVATHPGYRDTLPAPGETFVDGLLDRHRLMLANRPEANPGALKLARNYAGTTEFVAPGLMRGTMQEGSAIALSVPEGLARAIFYGFLVTEVHPFTDGNGRLSRLLMNAELSRTGSCRVIIPTLFHPQYIDCLKVLTRESRPAPFIKAIARMARWCATFQYAKLPELIKAMTATNAFEESPVRFKLGNVNDT